jgi:hypothetical protein
MAQLNNGQIELLKNQYQDAREAYLKAFCSAYEIKYEKNAWVDGNIVRFGDYFFDFEKVIKFSVDNGFHDFSELVEWYEYCSWAAAFRQTIPSFADWLQGFPHATQSEQKKLIELKRLFDETIQDYQNKY